MRKSSEGAMMAQIGSWSFIIGVLIAAFAGLLGLDPGFTLLALGTLGLVVGFLNISEAETVPFLVSTIAIMSAAGSLASALGNLVVILGISSWIGVFLSNIVAFVAPAAGVVAVKTIYALSKHGA